MSPNPSRAIIDCSAEVQKQAAAALREGRDVVIQSQTGSGKTLAFLLPLLSRLRYPPDVYPEDLKVNPAMQCLHWYYCSYFMMLLQIVQLPQVSGSCHTCSNPKPGHAVVMASAS